MDGVAGVAAGVTGVVLAAGLETGDGDAAATGAGALAGAAALVIEVSTRVE